MTEYKIKVPKKGSFYDWDVSWVTNYGNTMYLIWKEEDEGPIKEIKNTVDVLTHELIHLLLRENVSFSAFHNLDIITHFNSKKQQCCYKIGGYSYSFPTY